MWELKLLILLISINFISCHNKEIKVIKGSEFLGYHNFSDGNGVVFCKNEIVKIESLNELIIDIDSFYFNKDRFIYITELCVDSILKHIELINLFNDLEYKESDKFEKQIFKLYLSDNFNSLIVNLKFETVDKNEFYNIISILLNYNSTKLLSIARIGYLQFFDGNGVEVYTTFEKGVFKSHLVNHSDIIRLEEEKIKFEIFKISNEGKIILIK
jgi:hypothetical protein